MKKKVERNQMPTLLKEMQFKTSINLGKTQEFQNRLCRPSLVAKLLDIGVGHVTALGRGRSTDMGPKGYPGKTVR